MRLSGYVALGSIPSNNTNKKAVATVDQHHAAPHLNQPHLRWTHILGSRMHEFLGT